MIVNKNIKQTNLEYRQIIQKCVVIFALALLNLRLQAKI